MSLRIRTVASKSDLKAFVRFPFQLYKDCPYWVPPINKAEYFTLERGMDPDFGATKARLFLAERNGRIVGRIAAIINMKEFEKVGEKHTRFGWFDFEDDPEVSRALIEAATEWAQKEGGLLIKGPYGFTALDKAGMVVEGFDFTGPASTLYNYEYYRDHMVDMGFEKDVDWVEFEIITPKEPPARVLKAVDILQNRYGLHRIPLRTSKDVMRYVDDLFQLYVETYSELPGTVPLTQKQVEAYAKQYLPILRPDFVSFIADGEGEMIGFGITMPSMSRALQKAKGRLWPFGVWHIMQAKRKPRLADLVLIGIKKEWRSRGVHTIIFWETMRTYWQVGVEKVQVNPMLEQNARVQQLFKDYEWRPTRRRRAWKKAL